PCSASARQRHGAGARPRVRLLCVRGTSREALMSTKGHPLLQVPYDDHVYGSDAPAPQAEAPPEPPAPAPTPAANEGPPTGTPSCLIALQEANSTCLAAAQHVLAGMVAERESQAAARTAAWGEVEAQLKRRFPLAVGTSPLKVAATG